MISGIYPQKLNLLNQVAHEAIDELNQIEAHTIEHRKTCPCEGSKDTLDFIQEYRFGITEMIKRANETSDKAMRKTRAANGDKSQSN